MKRENIFSREARLQRLLKYHFPEIQTQLRKTDDPNGFKFIDIQYDDIHISIEIKDNQYGYSIFDKSSHPLDGLFSPAQEYYTKYDAVYHRIMAALLEKGLIPYDERK